MNPSRTAWLCLLLLSFAVACEGGGCSGCGGDYLAEASKTTAEVVRDYGGSVGEWQVCEAGARFRIGDGLRTGSASSALLSMQPSGKVLVEEKTTIRFERGDEDEVRRLELESGSVTVESDFGEIEIASADILTRVQKGSRVELRSEDSQSTVLVRAGRAVIEQDGEQRVLEAGQQLVLEVGGAVLELEANQEGDDEENAKSTGGALDAEEAAEAGDAADGRNGGGGSVGGDTPYDVLLRAGETATIHDPSVPTRIAIPVGDCPNGGSVEVARGEGRFGYREGRGQQHVTLSMPSGAFRYRVRCVGDGGELEEPSAGGWLRVVADAATRRLPAKSQRVRINADGRNYRIQYSNRLPSFVFTWRDAPPSGSYELHVELPNGRKLVRKRASSPEVALREGTIGEGEYHYWFEAGETSSKATTLDVTFQNQGRTAYLARALPKGSSADSYVLRGGALAQSQVSVGNKPVQLDAQGRFRTEIAVPQDARGVSVRVAHPSTGVHYYVRNAQ